jgi:hypothetical protein
LIVFCHNCREDNAVKARSVRGDVITDAERHHPSELLAAVQNAFGIAPQMRAEGDQNLGLGDIGIGFAELLGVSDIERGEFAADEIVAALPRHWRQHRRIDQKLGHPKTVVSIVLNSATLGR